MSAVGDEIDETLSRGVEQELGATASTVDEISRVHRRLPFDRGELDALRETIELWRRQGRNAAPIPIDPSYRETTEDERRELARTWLTGGLYFVSALDLEATLLIVKVDNGRGLFGGQKVHYACFFGSGDERYHSVGTTKNLTWALSKLGKLYRL